MDEQPTSVSYTIVEGVVSIVLDRPAASNALNLAMKRELLEALSTARTDHGVRAVAITANGKNFCVGQDLGEHVASLGADPAHAMDTVREHYNPIVLALNGIEVPVVVGITGACVGAGLGLALAADIRIAGERAKFGTAFTGIGLAADSGLSATLARLVGMGRAKSLFLLGDTFDAARAEQWGLVHRVVADADVATVTAETAATLATGPTRAYRAVKQLLDANVDAPLADVLDREAEAQRRLGASEDHRSAVEAFLHKRKPVFHGR
ncbi:enoyl-CoA hydratase/isomerase family protein [Nocardia pseudobrasiliensis]|uniref:2-(1,2-epoxy-1,2-dihydrophenyl)acetyl-CoA isomerase n=1 Tax=Nocardia pseudobrasiliensis TaxID=45979 RepID=A0A370IBF5_9NOCA|nr:enoyl-CoA hydratase-related protein [Nocardia pseudobrasiliensis]RDI68069.1 2-(1,2-epoxy-1,2-dihydrophenyl)acetyl-CoA isomerase [Nocardia pseudobrasiliensis]